MNEVITYGFLSPTGKPWGPLNEIEVHSDIAERILYQHAEGDRYLLTGFAAVRVVLDMGWIRVLGEGTFQMRATKPGIRTALRWLRNYADRLEVWAEIDYKQYSHVSPEVIVAALRSAYETAPVEVVA
mgnify:CR=1 FL=1